jgi:hypothetical protein
MDGQFEPLRGDLSEMQILLNVVSKAEHVPEIERSNRTIKERTRCIYSQFPFKTMPARMIIEMVNHSVFWLNSFVPEDGISRKLSPRALIVGTNVDYEKHCQLEFGTYVQTHEEHDNSMLPRTTGAIALRPTGNDQGGYYFLSLSTGRRLNRNHWTALPMPAEVVDRVHTLARRSRSVRGIEFFDRNGNPLADEDIDDSDSDDSDSEDESYSGSNDSSTGSDDDSNDARIAGVNEHDTDDNSVESNDDNSVESNANTVDNPPSDESDTNSNGDSSDDSDSDFDPDTNHESDIDDDDDAVSKKLHDSTPTHMSKEEMELKYGPRNNQHGLRPRHPRDYDHSMCLEHTMQDRDGITMTQHIMQKGLKKFGDPGIEAVLSELKQLHERNVLAPKKSDDLSQFDKKAALRYLMFLKQKRCGKIKARGCADGRKQKAYTNKEDASAPTVAIESLLLTCVIDATEQRDVATVDIPGAFMQADMDELVHMKLEGTMAELLVRLDPQLYRKYVQTERGKTVLYVELKKALYGTLRAALLFWRKLTEKLKEWAFKINPYDWCVANKTVNGTQCTIVWHVDDLKISHVSENVVTNVIKQLETEFGKEAPLTITRGKVHEYLGITLDFRQQGKVKITQIHYIQGMLDELPADMDGEAATAAGPHLFEVNPAAKPLDEDDSTMFHHNVAKLLFLCKRARPDTQTSVAFLSTRVKGPDVDDYKKLSRVMKYLRGTLQMPLTLEASNMSIIKWWVDVSYAVHPDMKSHTGGTMSLGKGTIYNTSTRQKLNTKSSTESELVGVNDVMPQVLWTRYFLESQGYGVKESIIYQDNQSSILLEKNGRGSSSKRTRHINIR